MRGIALTLMVVVAIGSAGCPQLSPTERIAYETVVASKAFIDKTKTQHPECVNVAGVAGQNATLTVNTSTVCTSLTRAVAAKDLLIDVVEALCAGPNFSAAGDLGACDFPKKGTPGYQQAADKVNAAIAGYNQAATDLKGAL